MNKPYYTRIMKSLSAVALLSCSAIVSCRQNVDSSSVSLTAVPETVSIPHGNLQNLTGNQEIVMKGFSIGRTEVTSAQYADFLNRVGYIEAAPTKLNRKGLRERSGTTLDISTVNDAIRSVFAVEGPDSTIKRTSRRTFIPKPGAEEAAANWVTYFGAVAYCRWLSERTGEAYRLPTSQEWQYAALTSSNVLQGLTTGVWEWCLDAPTDMTNSELSPAMSENHGHDDTRRAVRGGAWVSAPGGGILLDSPSRKADVHSETRVHVLGGITAQYGFRVLKEEPWQPTEDRSQQRKTEADE